MQEATANPRFCWGLLDTDRQVCVSLSWGPLLLFPGTWYAVFCLCPPRIYSPILCKFWQLYGGINRDLLQEGLCHTLVCCIQSPCPCDRPLITHPPQETLTVMSQCLWVPLSWWTRFVWALWASLAEMGFDSKCEFDPPTILLWLPLCPWKWGVSSWLLQRCTVTCVFFKLRI